MANLPDIKKADLLPMQDRPAADSADLILEPATDLEYVQTWYLNEAEWRGVLTLEQYKERERLLLQQDLTKDTITAWILTSAKLPLCQDGTRPILASCETLLKPAYVVRNGKVEEIIAHGIASVYTAHEYRGKGYASRMIAELGEKLQTWQQKGGNRGHFSILYSDIGKKFYDRFGWKPFPSSHILLQPINEEAYGRIKQSKFEVHELQTADLATIPTTTYAEERLRSLSSAKPDTAFVAIRPDFAHFRWHNVREEYYANAHGMRFPKSKGAIHRPSGVALIWCRIYAGSRSQWSLDILHTVMPPTATDNPDLVQILQALLLEAQLEAHRSGVLRGVEVWNPPEAVLAAAQKLRSSEDEKVEVIHRDKEHICSLNWIGGKEEDTEQAPVWVLNEKYAWC